MKIAIIMQRAKVNESDVVFADGVFLQNEEALQTSESIYDLCKNEKLDKEIIKRLKNNKTLALLYHPIKDDFGRLRPAIIVYENTISDKELQESLNKFGLDYNRFLELKNKRTKIKVIFGAMFIMILGVSIWIKNAF